MSAYAITIGPANARELTGMSWSHVRRVARDLGVRELRASERRVVIDARAWLDALRARDEREQVAAAPVDELEAARRAMGLELAR